LSSDNYFSEKHTKNLVVLHFTAGTTASGVYHTFAKPGKVATAYTVDRDGTVYEMFDPGLWAYHLGMRTGNTGHMHDKRSIAIEIVNVGPLKEDPENPDQLNWWPNGYGTKWCTKDETDMYVPRSDRGIDYYATFTDEQYESVNTLLDLLCSKYNIPRIAPDDKRRTDVNGLATYSGIIAHQHYRKDKYDMGPAFDWQRVGL
jgi:N-acetyl-anhydromuramyl-L-alanine amidase AmpD